MIHRQITIAIIDCVEPEKAVRVLDYCAEIFPVERRILLTHANIQNSNNATEVLKIEKLNSVDEYSAFVLRRLHAYIETEFCLLIQTDGFIVNPELWSDEFLKFDYIGAPFTDYKVWHTFLPESFRELLSSGAFHEKRWPMNGGFSLRSKKLLELTSHCPFDFENTAEDNYFNIIHRQWFESNGIKFAPRTTAYRFSRENPLRNVPFSFEDCFGFHGKISPAHILLAELPFEVEPPKCIAPLKNKIKTRIKRFLGSPLNIQDLFQIASPTSYIETLEMFDVYVRCSVFDETMILQTIANVKSMFESRIKYIYIIAQDCDELERFCNIYAYTSIAPGVLKTTKNQNLLIIESGCIIIRPISLTSEGKPIFYVNSLYKTLDFKYPGLLHAGFHFFVVSESLNISTDNAESICLTAYYIALKNMQFAIISTENRKWHGNADFWIELYRPSDIDVLMFNPTH